MPVPNGECDRWRVCRARRIHRKSHVVTNTNNYSKNKQRRRQQQLTYPSDPGIAADIPNTRPVLSNAANVAPSTNSGGNRSSARLFPPLPQSHNLGVFFGGGGGGGRFRLTVWGYEKNKTHTRRSRTHLTIPSTLELRKVSFTGLMHIPLICPPPPPACPPNSRSILLSCTLW
jgi:hypothetical protein